MDERNVDYLSKELNPLLYKINIEMVKGFPSIIFHGK